MSYPPILTTKRLQLIPASVEIIEAIIGASLSLVDLLSAQIPRGWPSEALQSFLPAYLQSITADPTEIGWGAWLVVLIEKKVLIGNFVFSGKPKSPHHIVEIGYEVLPRYRSQGYAFEAAEALVKWAFTHPELSRLFAQCQVDNSASNGLLAKLGMERLWREQDIMQWQLKREIFLQLYASSDSES